MIEIPLDKKVSVLEITDALGLNLTGNETRIKHYGNGTFSIESVGGDITIQSKSTGTYNFLGSSTTSAKLVLYENTDNGSNTITIKNPESLASSYTLTLPENDGDTNQILTTNGNGTLSWSSSIGSYVRTVVSTSSYTVTSSDDIIAVTYTTIGECTITLPAISSIGKIKLSIVDEGGNSGVNNIIVTYASGNYLLGLDGGSNNYIINSNYGSITIYNDELTNWFIYTG